MKLILTNNLSKQTYEIDGLEDMNDYNIYYHIPITLPEGMEDGEYTYALMDGEDILVTDLITIGETKRPDKPQYKPIPAPIYKQYGV